MPGHLKTEFVGASPPDKLVQTWELSLPAKPADPSLFCAADPPFDFGRLTRGQAELLNRTGNIEVGICDGTAARVDASSTRGSVRNTVPSQENPGPPASKVTVRARTRYGDIIIQRAAR